MTVTATASPLDSAYSAFSVTVAKQLASSNPALVTADYAGRRVARAANVSALPFSCATSAGYKLSATADLTKTHVDASLDIKSRAIHFLFTFYPSFTLAAHFEGSATCTLANGAALQLTIPVAAPLTLTVRPVFKVDVNGTLDGHTTWSPRMMIGFDRAPGVSENDIAFGSGIDFSATGQADANVFGGLSLELGVGGRLGVTGTAGPDLHATATINSNGSSATACTHVDGYVRADLTADADVFVKQWSWSLFHGEFFHKTLYDHCVTTSTGSSTPTPAPGPTPAPAPTPGPAPAPPPTPVPAPSPAPTFYEHHVYGTCRDGACGLRVHTAPSLSSPVTHVILDGQEVDVVCQARGDMVSNGYASSAIWDKQTDGTWVSDFYIDTPNVGTWSPPIPQC